MEKAEHKAPPLSRGSWLLACGLGLQLTWIASLFYEGAFFHSAGAGESFQPFYLASMVALVATLLGLAIFKARPADLPLFYHRPAGLVCAGLAAGGSLLACLGGFSSAWQLAAFVGGALLTGMGSAYVTLAWGCRLAMRRDVQPAVCLLLAYALSAVAYYALAHLPGPLFIAAASLLPVASVAVALLLDKNGEPDLDPTRPDQGSRVARVFATTLRPTKGGAKDGARSAGAESADADPSHTAPDGTQTDASAFARRIMAASLVFGMVQGTFQAAMGLGGAATPEHSTALMLVATVPLAGIAAFLIASRDKQDARFANVYRVALLAMICALLVGSCLDEGMGPVVLRVVLLTGYTFFKVVAWTLLCQLSRGANLSPVRAFGLGESMLTVGLLVSNSTMTLALQWTPLMGRVGRVAIAVGIALLLVAYLFVLTEQHIVAIGEMAREDDEDEQPTRFRFSDKLDQLSQRFGLTERESEILRLFVRGRSSARIAEDLVISSGTVTTHLRNIYKKANVHSRQELLDLLDAKPEADE